MPTFGTPTNVSGSPYSGLVPLAGAGLAGAGAATVAMDYVQTSKDAKMGKWVSLGYAAFDLWRGNQALSNANNAMTAVNSITATGALAAGDTPYIRTALQQLAVGLQNVTAGGATGLQQTVLPNTTPSAGSTMSTTNNGIVLVGLAAVLLLAGSK